MDSQLKRIRRESLKERVVTAEEAASWIQDGMTLGLSGFTRSGDAKAIPEALVKRAENESFKVNVFTGASLGHDIDKLFTEAGIVNKRLPFQADATMRKGINNGELLFVDHHLSNTSELVRGGVLPSIDIAVVEAVAITEDGSIIPSTSIGNSLIFAEHAKSIIVEINEAHSEEWEGIHDVYDPGVLGDREPIPLMHPDERIGTFGIPVDPEKIVGIVFTKEQDSFSTIDQPDDMTKEMASHLLTFLGREIEAGRLTNELAPLQSGIGSQANAVLHGLLDSEFENLEIYSEVLQDSVFELIDAGKVKSASCTSITVTEERMKQLKDNLSFYKEKIIMRPQEISNHPEVIRRLGTISINTALEFDIYGNVNSTHVTGTKMMNGIGGSGDFARNARLAIFVTKSLAKKGEVSSCVPFVSHVDHTEHDVDIIVTEQGYADLRGLAPKERVPLIIENCAHPSFRDELWAYYEEAALRGGHTPHILEKALSWHTRLSETGTMKQPKEEV